MLVLSALALALPSAAVAAPSALWVGPGSGSDRASGAQAHPLRTLTEAWRRAGDGSVINVTAGRVRAEDAPAYWEDKRGVTVRGHGRVVLPAINMAAVRRVVFERLTVRGDVHCERCSHWTLRSVRIRAGGAQEALKVNQSDHVRVLRSDIAQASDNALDFVAVQHAMIARSRIHGAGDWCAYVKGGSAYVRVHDNEIHDCGTGGFTAGQGTGLQFMTPPWLQYEAYDVRVVRNLIHDTEGAGLGVNGGYNVLLASNTLRRVGARSHAIEVVHGHRSCDGRPGDEGRERCAAYLRQGAWGTTAVDDGTNYVRIPNRHVFVYNNSVLRASGAARWMIARPYDSEAQRGSGAPSPARADDDLRRGGNSFSGGPLGTVPVPGFGAWEVPVPQPRAAAAAATSPTIR